MIVSIENRVSATEEELIVPFYGAGNYSKGNTLVAVERNSAMKREHLTGEHLYN